MRNHVAYFDLESAGQSHAMQAAVIPAAHLLHM
jgi:hypothetical protein